MTQIATFPQGPIVDSTGEPTAEFSTWMTQIIQNLQQDISDEGFVMPSQDVTNINLIEPNAATGTLIFNTSLSNGSLTETPNGQLMVKLADGVFHPVTNS